MTPTPTATRRLRGRDLLRAVAEGTAAAGTHVRVVAGWYDGRPIEDPFEYTTRGQPCALVPGQAVVAFPEALVTRFPEDQAAIDMGLESYLAVCLRDSGGGHLGHLAVLDTRRMEAGEEDVAALRIFAARAAAELERRNQAVALSASRARVIEAADTERRRVGRDLHDGAQQRLLAVSNLLRVARKRAPDGADALLARAEEELTAAHAELRELARGLHPVALAERGLAAAVESLSATSSVPVQLDVCQDALPDDVAAAAYFIVAECLTNAARYGQASSVLGGRLEVHSPPAHGTRVRAFLPLA